MIRIKKKNGSLEKFNRKKIVNAVNKSAERVMVKFKELEYDAIVNTVLDIISTNGLDSIDIPTMHKCVELALDTINPKVATSYREYRNYKTNFVSIMDKVYLKNKSIMFVGDRENSNTDSALVSTRRVLAYNAFNEELYKSFNLTEEERQACDEGYIYVHDRSSRRDTYNCCLFDAFTVMGGGFEMGNMWYNEPTNIDKACDVLGDIMSVKASQQYGGLTIPEVDRLLAPMLKKSHIEYLNNMIEEAFIVYGMDEEDVRNDESMMKIISKRSMDKARIDLEDGIQGIEYKANSVASSRGDYPFLTFTFGENTEDPYAVEVAQAIMKVRKKGQGKKGKKKCVLFPKLVFLYVEDMHGEGKDFEFLFDDAIDCSASTMYPDYLSLTGEGYVSEIYKKYKKIISPMGCRAFLSPWYKKGGMFPADEQDEPIFIGRANIGAVSLHLPMILQKARIEGKDFYDVLEYYMEMIRKIHLKTYEYLGEMRASMDPLAFCEGGFYGGNLQPEDKILPVLESFTASFGVTALNELQYLYNGKTIADNNEFSLEVMKWMNNKINEYKEEDHRLYAIYATPAESLCGKQVQQFRDKYGIIKGVSDRDYVSNSFH